MAVDATQFGIWEAGPGFDVDVDEVFLVLAGSGTVPFEVGSTIELRPGFLVRLIAGDRTTWNITERRRKLYFSWPGPFVQ
ncbi:cupin domain-containing protein [Nonomuraea turcica]|uniref:cupin domain-containing protein n=1 Tax=Nonomuraea sp. G32 TaxID=3067274 RepID=UPI00273CC0BF|nr:cupin domain-containing protein [Nonomuraea sp. G32]MDP4512089.1 cupin domain-containing protein [Nonomuraea sp. G32]